MTKIAILMDGGHTRVCAKKAGYAYDVDMVVALAMSCAQSSPAAPRRIDLERILCDAMAKKVLVHLRYDDDVASRSFQPEVLYHSTTHKVLVAGVQVNNPEKPLDQLEPRFFEVGKMTSVTITDSPFVRAPDYNRFDARYANGIICSA